MTLLLAYWNYFWYGLMAFPLQWIHRAFHLDIATPWKAHAWKAFFLALFLFILMEVWIRIRAFQRKRRQKDMMTEVAEESASLKAKDTSFTETLEAVQAPEQMIAALKKEKRYERLGQVYSSLNRNLEAAGAYRKAGDLKAGAMELAKAGSTLKAAKWLEKTGDYATAARFWEEKAKYKQAAKAYGAANDAPKAAAMYVKCKKHKLAASVFLDYFAGTSQNQAEALSAAEACYSFLQDKKALAALEEDQLRSLYVAMATCFAQAKRVDIAAGLFRKGGQSGRAGELYLSAGKLQEAAQCMQEAGRKEEAAGIGARYYEAKGLWKEAGMAYEGAGNLQRAGDCFSKANDATRAAACYSRAGEHYGAGLACIHAKEWGKAVPMLQQVSEQDERFYESRALLGRCFYHMHDFEQCVATLENQLTGERVRASNIEYFWMLALAYEQVGNLEESKSILHKIRSVDVNFRDVSQRLSNIEDRISMAPAHGEEVMAPTIRVQNSPGKDAVMTMVAKSIGERYALEQELGRGGMGVIYLARDTQLDRQVALKFLGSLVDNSEEYRKRFVREAKAAAKVSHPNIVSIYDIGTQEGKAYIAMEYIEGPNLGKYYRDKGHLSPREAVNVMVQTLSAVQAIHEVGIIHRDLKPDNVLIARGGLVKVTDFGLAKFPGARLTGKNVVLGTPCYMAPEQVTGQDVDLRADLYALGLVLHELLTGKTVFIEGNVLERQKFEVPDPPSALVEGIPEALDQLVMHAIEKDPKQRFANAQEFLSALRSLGR